MNFLRDAVRIELVTLTAGFAVVVFWKLLRNIVGGLLGTGLRGALLGGAWGSVHGQTAQWQLAQWQLAAVSLILAFIYLLRLMQSADSGRLPPVPNGALALLAGSQALFLSSMAWRVLRRPGVQSR